MHICADAGGDPAGEKEVLVEVRNGNSKPRARGRARSILTIVLAASLVTVVLGGIATAATSSVKQKSALPAKITIGVLDSMSGSAGFCGVQEMQGVSLAVKEAKASHLLGKTQIAVKLVDDRTNLEAAASGTHQLIDANVAAIVGPCVGGGANVAMPIATQAGMPMVITTASAADVSPPNVFRAGIPQPRYASNVIKLLAKRGVKKVAVFYDTGVPTISGPVWNQTQKVALKALKIEVSDLEAAPVASSGLSDFSSQVAKMIQSKPDAIGVLLQGAPNLTVVNQLRQAGFKGDIWGQQGMVGPFFLEGGPNVNGVLVSVSFAAGLGPASSVNFAKRFGQLYKGVVPTELSAHGYDSMFMALRAIKDANSTDHAKIIAALAKIKTMPAAQGKLRFNSIGDAVGSGFVAKFSDGKLVGVGK
jgi:branched-chain amino acid transport system substrate-binding protein